MTRRNATPLCHCGELDTGMTHWSRCIVCHPEQKKRHLAGWCELHFDKRHQAEAVAIYAGIVALGEWARDLALRQRVKCPTCRCMRRVWPPPGPCPCCDGQFDLEPEDYP